MKQLFLFDEMSSKNQPKANSLIIDKRAVKILSKSQRTFNRLSKKIEKLQNGLEDKTTQLNECMQFYGSEINPLEQNILLLRKEIIKLLYECYNNKKPGAGKLGKKKRLILEDIIRIQLENVFCSNDNEPDEEMKNIYQTLCGVSYDALVEEDFSEMLEEMEFAFSSMGMDVDLSDLDMESSQEDILLKMAKIEEEAISQFTNQPKNNSTKKKTKKQLKKEAIEKQMEEIHNRSIKSIYIQLAKVLHPDLEQDASVREEKKSLMQKLTSAYKANDLHTLLYLELQWIHKENSHLETLSEEKLSIYNRLLKQQVKELEEEHSILLYHPRYAPLLEFYDTGFHRGSLPNITILTSMKSTIQDHINSFSSSIKCLKGDKPIVEVRNIINSFRIQETNG